MISVLTITYKRHHLLEEAIESFLRQNAPDCEMVVVNDNPEVDYVYEHENVRIINCKERFPSISSKLEWGYKQCKHDYIYRLDDDDLLAPWALENVKQDIANHLGYEIYRSSGMYFFVNNKFQKKDSNINNGNVYTKAYLDRIKFPDKSGDEDMYITFRNDANIYESTLKHTMIYRWGMNTLHISGMGIQPNDVVLAKADEMLDSTQGTITLSPHFDSEYYEQLPQPYQWHK
jgi:glycosyltransferase involved in cell wall biosynthesis